MELRTFGNYLALVLIALGGSFSLLWMPAAGSGPGLRASPTFAAGLPDRRDGLAEVSADSLQREAEQKALFQLAQFMKPDAPLREWKGVVAVQDSGSSESLAALYSDLRRFADGPPFHLILGPGENIEATPRWKRQLRWKVAGLEGDDAWIGVVILPSTSPRLIALTKKLLSADPWSEGGLATRENLETRAVQKVPSR